MPTDAVCRTANVGTVGKNGIVKDLSFDVLLEKIFSIPIDLCRFSAFLECFQLFNVWGFDDIEISCLGIS